MHVGIAKPGWWGNVPGIPGACETRYFTYEAHGQKGYHVQKRKAAHTNIHKLQQIAVTSRTGFYVTTIALYTARGYRSRNDVASRWVTLKERFDWTVYGLIFILYTIIGWVKTSRSFSYITPWYVLKIDGQIRANILDANDIMMQRILFAKRYIGYNKEVITTLLYWENDETIRLEQNYSQFAEDILKSVSSQTDICILIIWFLWYWCLFLRVQLTMCERSYFLLI